MHQEQELANLAEEFSRFRKNKKRAKYPQGLWDKAANVCERYPYQKVAHLLGVHSNSLRRHLHSVADNLPDFVPIQITQLQSPLQIHLKTPIPITIEFSRSTEELAKLLMTIQKGVSC
jgi:hypothetical protein